MPEYRTHVSVNFFLGLPLSLAALKYTVLSTPTDVFAFSVAFIYGTLFLHPDIDLARNIRLFSLKGLLTLPFRPYSHFFRHRGISHMLIIGTATRILWLFGFVWLLCSCLNLAFPDLVSWNHPFLWFGIGGIAAADFFHILLDKLG